MSSTGHEHAELAPPVLIEVADRVFAYVQPDGSWYINNTGVVVGRSSVVSIDTCATERRTRALRESIASVSPAPVTTLINTHHHGDHTYGNSILGAATIVGHESCRTVKLIIAAHELINLLVLAIKLDPTTAAAADRRPRSCRLA